MAAPFDLGRLRFYAKPEENEAAIRGETVPENLGNPTTRLCLVRGIRYNDGFAPELANVPELPEITRAINARAIMSNRVPEMHIPEEFPYCFWHPDIPTQTTLRHLLDQYPDNLLLRYQVGRACAVGGYTSLYQELELLPEVAIAEEARDNKTSGHGIYELIMQAPIRYSYMDDYNLCLRDRPIADACLNGDTCVRSVLSKKQPLCARLEYHELFQPPFDITEDKCVDLKGMVPSERPVDPIAVSLLHNPLPTDLPTVDKDILILMAAWSGNIERYARLRRPTTMGHGERHCVIRGIHHYPFFAKWMSTQLRGEVLDIHIRWAINARSVMNNDLSWLTDRTPEDDMPHLIWYPQKASAVTYEELVRRQPSMKSRVALACIHANYQDLFDKLNVTPDALLWLEAKKNQNKHYYKTLNRRAHELGMVIKKIERETTALEDDDGLYVPVLQQEFHHGNDLSQSLVLGREVTLYDVGGEYSGMASSRGVGYVILHACVADPSMRPSAPYDALDLSQVYRDLPYVEDEEDRRMVGLWPGPRGGYRGRGRGSRRG
ncbi:hypothetical protein BDV12DRAFT_176499 [Aspergillus spectabilis]